MRMFEETPATTRIFHSQDAGTRTCPVPVCRTVSHAVISPHKYDALNVKAHLGFCPHTMRRPRRKESKIPHGGERRPRSPAIGYRSLHITEI